MNVMDHLHLAGVDEEDPYGDFNNYNAALDTEVGDGTLLLTLPSEHEALTQCWYNVGPELKTVGQQ